LFKKNAERSGRMFFIDAGNSSLVLTSVRVVPSWPMVVAYRASPLTYAVARRVMTVRWVSLVNLIAGREVVPELLQDRLTVDGCGRAAPVAPHGERGARPPDGLATWEPSGTPGGNRLRSPRALGA
jgi:lipid-A-disaccharide synthase